MWTLLTVAPQNGGAAFFDGHALCAKRESFLPEQVLPALVSNKTIAPSTSAGEHLAHVIDDGNEPRDVAIMMFIKVSREQLAA
jgi:hypothetical protein